MKMTVVSELVFSLVGSRLALGSKGVTQVTQVMENTHGDPTQDLAVPWPDRWGFASEQPSAMGWWKK